MDVVVELSSKEFSEFRSTSGLVGCHPFGFAPPCLRFDPEVLRLVSAMLEKAQKLFEKATKSKNQLMQRTNNERLQMLVGPPLVTLQALKRALVVSVILN